MIQAVYEIKTNSIFQYNIKDNTTAIIMESKSFDLLYTTNYESWTRSPGDAMNGNLDTMLSNE